MSSCSPTRVLLIAVITVIAGQLAIPQQLLFSTLGPGESFPPGPGFTVGGGELWKMTGNNGSIGAAAFTPSITAPFHHADFSLQYMYEPTLNMTGPPDITFTLTSDDGGVPGTTIETIPVTNVSDGSMAAAIVTATSLLHPVLQSGMQYWFVVAPPNLLQTAYAWALGPTDAQNQMRIGQSLFRLTAVDTNWGAQSGGSSTVLPQGLGLAVYGGTANPPTAAILANGIVNAASYAAATAAGSWISIFGAGLAESSRGWQPSDFPGDGSLPISLDGVSVLINGQAAAVSYVSPGQINAQIPDFTPNDLAVYPIGLQVITPAGTSNLIPITVDYTAPALFASSTGGVQYAAATFADGTLTTAANPAHAGDAIALYGTGFGPTNPAVASGTLVTTPEPLEVTPAGSILIGEVGPQITYAGLVEAGLDQINVVVPSVGVGNVPISIWSNGSVSQTVMLPVAAQ
jgi:uncharacterized protein (TIGR03437 family)